MLIATEGFSAITRLCCVFTTSFHQFPVANSQAGRGPAIGTAVTGMIGRKKQFNILRQLMGREDVDTVVCATDAGREGELIFRLTYNLCKCTKPGPVPPDAPHTSLPASRYPPHSRLSGSWPPAPLTETLPHLVSQQSLTACKSLLFISFPQPWQCQVLPDTRNQFQILRQLMSRDDVDTVICATDGGGGGGGGAPPPPRRSVGTWVIMRS